MLGITGGVLWHVAIGFALVGGSYDPSLIHTAFAVPLSLTMSALACEVAAATVQWSITEGRYAGRRAAPRVRLLSAGPTGVVLAF